MPSTKMADSALSKQVPWDQDAFASGSGAMPKDYEIFLSKRNLVYTINYAQNANLTNS